MAAYISFFPPCATQPIVGVYFTALYRALASSRTRLLDHKHRRATVGRTPLNEWSARRRDLYLTRHNTHNRQHIHAPGGIRTHDRSRGAAVDLRLRPCGYWDRRGSNIRTQIWELEIKARTSMVGLKRILALYIPVNTVLHRTRFLSK